MTSDEIARLIRGVDHRDPKRDIAHETNPEFVEVTERLLKIAADGTETEQFLATMILGLIQARADDHDAEWSNDE